MISITIHFNLSFQTGLLREDGEGHNFSPSDVRPFMCCEIAECSCEGGARQGKKWSVLM